MRGDPSIRKVRTASGAIAVQVIRYTQGKRIIVRHIGSSHTDEELAVLCQEVKIVQEQLSFQPSLFSNTETPSKILHEDYLQLSSVTHCFAYQALKKCSGLCGLAFLHPLYQDLALIRKTYNYSRPMVIGMIVGARLANTPKAFIESMTSCLKKQDGSVIRLAYPNRSCDVICTYSEKRAKKERREFDKQIAKAREVISQQALGKRTKFVKKSADHKDSFVLNEELKEKTEKLIGIKGYCTNIAESILSHDRVVEHYHGLWHVEQAFRMSKTDLKTRPIFHYVHETIRAHVLLCFMGLMMGKFLEIKTGLS